MQIVSRLSVLHSAQVISENSDHVSIDAGKLEAIALRIIKASKERRLPSWNDHSLNPKDKTKATLNW